MNTSDAPGFLTSVFAEVTEQLHRCLDEAYELAGGHFQEHGMTDPVYHAGQSHLARAHARRMLVDQAGRGTLGEWSVAPPAPNVQVCLNRGPLQLRLLRPDRDQVPKPGTNASRIAWFSNRHDTLAGIEDSRLIGLWYPGPDGQIEVRVVRTIGEARWGRRNRIDLDMILPGSTVGISQLEFRPSDDGEIQLPFEQPADDTGSASL